MTISHARRSVAAGLALLMATILATESSPAAGEERIRTIPLEGRFTALDLGQRGGTAVLVEEGRGGVVLVDVEMGSIDRPELGLARIVDALPLPDARSHIVVGTTPKGDTTIYHVEPRREGPAPSQFTSIPLRAGGAALGDDLVLYIRAANDFSVLRFDLCETGELEIEACGHRGIEGAPYGALDNVFYLPGPPLVDLKVDAKSGILVAVQQATAEVLGLEARSGRTLFAHGLGKLEPPLRLAGAIGERATVFVSAPQAGWIEVFDIDRKFREWSPSGRIDLAALRGTQSLTVSLDEIAKATGAGPDPEAWQELAGKVAVGPEQELMFIAGLDPGTIHVIERIGSTNRLALNIRSETGRIRDFALSPDGGHLGVLLDGMLVVSPVHAGLVALIESAGQDQSVGVDKVEQAIVIAVQTRLSEEGFYRGVVDGDWGPESQAALARFQLRNGIDTAPTLSPASADAETLGALFADDLGSFPVDAFGVERAEAVRAAAFARFFARNLPQVRYFEPAEIYTTGKGGDREKCRPLNALPEEALWPAILPAVRLLDAVRAGADRPIDVLSSYQTADYANCVDTPAEIVELHGQFAAIEFTVAGQQATPEAAKEFAERYGGGRGVIVVAGLGSFHLAVSPDAQPRERLGEWQAVIASYRPGAHGCAEAQADVEEFADLLRGTGLAGAQIYIARTAISDHYAVTVDLGDNKERAQEAVSVIRRVALFSADGRTGADSFPQINKGWRIDERCRRVSVLD